MSHSERADCLAVHEKAMEYLWLRGLKYVPLAQKYLQEKRWCEDFDVLLAEEKLSKQKASNQVPEIKTTAYYPLMVADDEEEVPDG